MDNNTGEVQIDFTFSMILSLTLAYEKARLDNQSSFWFPFTDTDEMEIDLDEAKRLIVRLLDLAINAL